MGLEEHRKREPKQVYQPAEDSDLLATAAREEVSPTDCVLDVGTGSGYVAAEIANTGARVIGSDRNPHACQQARKNGIETVRTNLVAAFAPETFDLVTFNPPYLPTTPDEAVGNWMEIALSGGESGREVIEPFLTAVGRVLAPEGRVLLLVSSLSGVETITECATEVGFDSTTVATDSFPFETLSVLRLTPR